MDITYLGHSSFRIRGRDASLITDPFDPSLVGMKFPKVEADIVTVSHDHKDHNAYAAVGGSPFVINGPGEYEVKGVSVIGYPAYHDDVKGAERGKNTIYRIELEGVSVVHLGDIGHLLDTEIVESLGTVDVLLVPCGGTYTVDAAKAKKIISDIEPSVVIPMHYRTSEHDAKAFGTLADLPALFSELGKDAGQPVPKLMLKKGSIPEEMQIVVLSKIS